MNALHGLDVGIVVVYLVVTVVAGLWMTRKAAQSLENYFLGGRKMPWYLLGIAGMTNWFDLTGTMIITSFLYMLGPRGLFVEFRGGAVLSLPFMLLWAGKWHRRSGCMTYAEWMTYRFGTGPAAEALRFLTALMGIIIQIGMMAYLTRGTSFFVGLFIPYSPIVVTAILIALTALYTLLAGFYGVVIADLIQGVIIIVSCVVIAVVAFVGIPNYAEVARLAGQVTGNPEWTKSMPAWHTPMPAGYEMYQSLIIVAGFYLLRYIFGGAGSGGESRYFGARNDKECGWQSLLQGVTVAFRWPLMIGFAVLGVFLVHEMVPDQKVLGQATTLIRQHYPDTTQPYWHELTSKIIHHPESMPAELREGLVAVLGTNWQSKLHLASFNGTVDPELILPSVLLYKVPVGVKGFLLVAMLAAMMSTLTSGVNGASAFFVKDIYQNFLRPKAGNHELIVASYLSTLGIVAAGFIMGVATKSINEIWGWIIMSLTTGSLAPGLLRLYWWRCNAWGAALGTLLGGVGAIVQRLLVPEMLEWKQFVLMTAVSFAATIIGSLVTKPTPEPILRNFYRTTRPFGWWRRFWNELSETEKLSWRREHRTDLIALPFTMLAQVTLFLLTMQLVIHAFGSFWETLPLFLVGAAGMYWFWWRNLKYLDQADHK